MTMPVENVELLGSEKELAANANPLLSPEDAFFKAALFGDYKQLQVDNTTSSSCDIDYLALPDQKNSFLTDLLIIRPCYKHLLPLIHNELMGRDNGMIAGVTGTPGIGKSVFGIVLLRHFIHIGKTVLYWENDDVYLFTFDEKIKSAFQLFEFGAFQGQNDGGTRKICYAARWDVSTKSYAAIFGSALLQHKVVIHDPKQGDMRVAYNEKRIYHLVYILSHGHSLISYWGRKGGGPDKYYLPVWSKAEIEKSLPLLKRQDKNVSQISFDEVDSLYCRYGGCIRGWLVKDQGDFWNELVAKVKEVAKNHGDNVLERNTSSRGSIIHTNVDFDETLEPFPFVEGANMMSLEEDSFQRNTFDKYRYVFGSSDILEALDQELVRRSDKALQHALISWASVPGFEGVYGALYELRCHRRFENEQNLKLKMRVVYNDPSKNTDKCYEVEFPRFVKVVRFKSQDPSIIEEERTYPDLKKDYYLWPRSSSFPSYDSAAIVDGTPFGLDGVVGLLFQMTVSGSTGIPRRPEHSVKQHIRRKFHKAFESRKIAGYKNAYTAFVVPTECFEKFVFQKESIKDSDDGIASSQPQFQLVFEMEDIFTYKPM
ncbi:MAG: hypothetical protein SGILL_004798, partial [Bacillariaceae sp.]